MQDNGVTPNIFSLNQSVSGTITGTVGPDIVSLIGSGGPTGTRIEVSICAITRVNFTTATAPTGPMLCDPNAGQCDCDASIRELFVPPATPPSDIFLRDNNNSPVSLNTVVATCNDVVWINSGGTDYNVIPYNTIFNVRY
jgi:hypothetical protein